MGPERGFSPSLRCLAYARLHRCITRATCYGHLRAWSTRAGDHQLDLQNSGFEGTAFHLPFTAITLVQIQSVGDAKVFGAKLKLLKFGHDLAPGLAHASSNHAPGVGDADG